MILTNSDKAGHGYLPTYQHIADEINATIAHPRVLELGVAGGDSLLLWEQLFPHATRRNICGVDINAQAIWPEGFVKVVGEQDDPDLPGRILEAMKHPTIPQFHLIVDDASHDAGLTRTAFQHLWPLLYPGGYYVIEDWSHANMIMGGLAAELPALAFDDRDPLSAVLGIEFITYRPGMIILRKLNLLW